MPTFSFVIAVFNVEVFLPECLESIQAFADLEIVAVDDHSTDGSRAVLERFARADGRVRVLSTPANSGAGPARNVGLEAATGDYVWFFDGDDWLETGALDAVAKRIDETEPDMLMVNWVRAYADGSVARGSADKLFRKAPRLFSVGEWPAALEVLHAPWTKVYQRKFLLRCGVAFSPGLYQDVPHTYVLLVRAERIAVLETVCVNYRQHPTSVTRTQSARHFDVLVQWDRTHELLSDALSQNSMLRLALFRRMVWHFLRVLNNPRKIPAHLKRRFFEQAAARYRQYLPSDYRRPPGLIGLYHRLLASRTYWPLALAMAAAKMKRRIGVRLRGGATRSRD